MVPEPWLPGVMNESAPHDQMMTTKVQTDVFEPWLSGMSTVAAGSETESEIQMFEWVFLKREHGMLELRVS